MKYIKINNELILRDAEERDIEDYMSVPFSKELLEMYGSTLDYKTPKSKDKAKLLIAEIRKEPYEWAIEYKGTFIGQVRLVVDSENNKAKFAIGIFNSEYWSKGIGTKVTKEVLKYGFETLKLHRIHLKVLKYNQRGIQAYENAGFIKEGEERETALINGTYYSDIHMSVLAKEYLK
ncbi:GNAT family protein [Mammaliicoccus sp. Dog046]|uniref:GNAT family N-acetyltransferase n=1 Tax=Mammaliicoccus sp. Dog046 TaxID=3034233 RepID=UPI002B25D33D|nr:GNAT family protein [Mammaliicoccus sp. Dog046]WQK84939.1 GNAT family protein [Mammaliicoccus sp. Dog046]